MDALSTPLGFPGIPLRIRFCVCFPRSYEVSKGKDTLDPGSGSLVASPLLVLRPSTIVSVRRSAASCGTRPAQSGPVAAFQSRDVASARLAAF